LAALLEHELPAEREGTLTVRDNRTGAKYKIPIIHSAVPAAAFRQICVDSKDKTSRQQYEDGLRVIDPGYRNTAVKLSAITYMCVKDNSLVHHPMRTFADSLIEIACRNGADGIILYRGQPLGSLVGRRYEEYSHLLIWGMLPSELQSNEFHRNLAEAMTVPDNVHKIVASFP
jgi:citrate synthase